MTLESPRLSILGIGPRRCSRRARHSGAGGEGRSPADRSPGWHAFQFSERPLPGTPMEAGVPEFVHLPRGPACVHALCWPPVGLGARRGWRAGNPTAVPAPHCLRQRSPVTPFRPRPQGKATLCALLSHRSRTPQPLVWPVRSAPHRDQTRGKFFFLPWEPWVPLEDLVLSPLPGCHSS